MILIYENPHPFTHDIFFLAYKGSIIVAQDHEGLRLQEIKIKEQLNEIVKNELDIINFISSKPRKIVVNLSI